MLSANGLCLRGTLKSTLKIPGALVVICHGNRRGGRKHRLYNALADRLMEEFAVLSFDFHGFGESQKPHGGEFPSFDFRSDIQAAARYMADRYGQTPADVVLIGHSMGSTQVLRTARELDSRLAIAIGLIDYHRIVTGICGCRRYAKKIKRSTGVALSADHLIDFLQPLMLDTLLADCFHGHTCFIYGSKEAPFPVRRHIDHLADKCANKTDLFVVPRADHMFGTERTRLLAGSANVRGKNDAVTRLAATIKETILQNNKKRGHN